MFLAINHHNISDSNTFLSTPIGVCNHPISPAALVQLRANVCNHHATRSARPTTKKKTPFNASTFGQCTTN